MQSYGNVKLTSVAVANTNPDMQGMDAYRVTLRFDNRSMVTDFYMGVGQKGEPPDVQDVLSCLISDARSIENASGFEDWAQEFGYSTDSREAERRYKKCRQLTRSVRRLLGDQFETFADKLRDY